MRDLKQAVQRAGLTITLSDGAFDGECFAACWCCCEPGDTLAD